MESFEKRQRERKKREKKTLKAEKRRERAERKKNPDANDSPASEEASLEGSDPRDEGPDGAVPPETASRSDAP